MLSERPSDERRCPTQGGLNAALLAACSVFARGRDPPLGERQCAAPGHRATRATRWKACASAIVRPGSPSLADENVTNAAQHFALSARLDPLLRSFQLQRQLLLSDRRDDAPRPPHGLQGLRPERQAARAACLGKHHCDAAKTSRRSRRRNNQGSATVGLVAPIARHQHATLLVRGLLASLWHP